MFDLEQIDEEGPLRLYRPKRAMERPRQNLP
jgi:hypothetical protein